MENKMLAVKEQMLKCFDKEVLIAEMMALAIKSSEETLQQAKQYNVDTFALEVMIEVRKEIYNEFVKEYKKA